MTVGLKRQSELQRGITGLETAIIGIAFVAVASVFASTVLSTGVFSAERSKATVYAGLSEVRSSLATRGSFVAFFGKVSSTQTRTNSVSLSPRPSAVVIPSISRRRILSTTPAPTRTSSAGTAYRLTLNCSGENNFLSDIPWTVGLVGNSNSDNLLDNEEKDESTGWVFDRNTQTAIGSNDSVAQVVGSGYDGGADGMMSSDTVLTISGRFTLEVVADGSAVLAVERRLPDAFKNVMTLK